MTKTEFKKSVSQSAKRVLNKLGLRYMDIVFTNMPTIAIGDVFFCQGDDASELLNNVPDGINKRSYILFYLDSAGAL